MVKFFVREVSFLLNRMSIFQRKKTQRENLNYSKRDETKNSQYSSMKMYKICFDLNKRTSSITKTIIHRLETCLSQGLYCEAMLNLGREIPGGEEK